MSEKLNRKDLKVLKNTLGKQRISINQFETAQSSSSSIHDSGVVNIDSFSFGDNQIPSDLKDNDGWYVGYGVEYSGVGVSSSKEVEGASESEEEESPVVNNITDNEISSGFSSDSSSEEESENTTKNKKSSSGEGSDDGQLLYGVASRNGVTPELYLNKAFKTSSVILENQQSASEDEKTIVFENSMITQTNRFKCSNRKQSFDKVDKNGYQIIGTQGEQNIDDTTNRNETLPTNLQGSVSSGLWTNFVINLADLEGCNGARKDEKKIEIPQQKLSSITLDNEKLSQISAAMANFSLPTPPGWENIDDQKLLSFIKQRIL